MWKTKKTQRRRNTLQTKPRFTAADLEPYHIRVSHQSSKYQQQMLFDPFGQFSINKWLYLRIYKTRHKLQEKKHDKTSGIKKKNIWFNPRLSFICAKQVKLYHWSFLQCLTLMHDCSLHKTFDKACTVQSVAGWVFVWMQYTETKLFSLKKTQRTKLTVTLWEQGQIWGCMAISPT